eukprot:2780100-Rhodomonas_salina.1
MPGARPARGPQIWRHGPTRGQHVARHVSRGWSDVDDDGGGLRDVLARAAEGEQNRGEGLPG